MSQGMKEQRLEGEVMLSVCLRWKRLKPILSLMVVWWGAAVSPRPHGSLLALGREADWVRSLGAQRAWHLKPWWLG